MGRVPETLDSLIPDIFLYYYLLGLAWYWRVSLSVGMKDKDTGYARGESSHTGSAVQGFCEC